MTTGRINQVTFSFDQDEKGIAPPYLALLDPSTK